MPKGEGKALKDASLLVNLNIYIEFGFRCAEKGMSLDQALHKAMELLTGKKGA